MATKKCRSCQKVKDVDEFPARSELIDGLSPYCRGCWSERNKERYGDLYEQQAEYRRANIDKRREWNRAYHERNREEILARRRQRYAESKLKKQKKR